MCGRSLPRTDGDAPGIGRAGTARRALSPSKAMAGGLYLGAADQGWISMFYGFRALAVLVVTLPLGLGVFGPGARAQQRVVPPSPEALRMSYAPIVQRVTPAVVTVSAAKIVANRNPLMEDPFFRRFFGGPQFGGPREQRSLGSGVIVEADGLVVTNNHVIDGADQVKVTLADKREFSVDVVLKDPRTD